MEIQLSDLELFTSGYEGVFITITPEDNADIILKKARDIAYKKDFRFFEKLKYQKEDLFNDYIIVSIEEQYNYVEYDGSHDLERLCDIVKEEYDLSNKYPVDLMEFIRNHKELETKRKVVNYINRNKIIEGSSKNSIIEQFVKYKNVYSEIPDKYQPFFNEEKFFTYWMLSNEYYSVELSNRFYIFTNNK